MIYYCALLTSNWFQHCGILKYGSLDRTEKSFTAPITNLIENKNTDSIFSKQLRTIHCYMSNLSSTVEKATNGPMCFAVINKAQSDLF